MTPRAARIAVIASLALATGAAALATHGYALQKADTVAFAGLSFGGRVLLVFLGLFVLALASRHLVMIALALCDYWRQATAPPMDTRGPHPFVSIIVPAFNEAPMIRDVLEALLQIDYPSFEVIVVDDGSSDETYLRAMAFERRRPDLRCRVLAKGNGGKFDALNHGIAQAGGEIVVCIDGDSLLHPDALKHCVPHFADPAVGAVAGCVRVANRGTVWSALQALEYVVGLGLVKRAQSAAGTVTIVPGPLGAFRKAALSQINGYDGDTFAEDFDLTVKLLSEGWHIVYEPRAIVFTEAPERTQELLRQRYRWTRGSLQVLLKRKHGMRTPRGAPLRFFGLWYMALDCLALPAINLGLQLAFVAGGLLLGVHSLMIFWWLQLVVFEAAVVLFCVVLEDEPPWLMAVSPLFRVFYHGVLDTARLFAAGDELARANMSWDKLARLGRLGAPGA